MGVTWIVRLGLHLPRPSLLAVIAGTYSIVFGWRQLRTAFQLDAIFAELLRFQPSTVRSMPPYLLGTLWIVVGIGILLERNWARIAFRTLVIAEWVQAALLYYWLPQSSPGAAMLLRLASSLYLAVTLRFHDEWSSAAPGRLLWHILVGCTIQVWHQLRHLAGFSYLHWSYSPAMVGASSRSAGGYLVVEQKLDLPPYQGPGWTRVGEVLVESGRLRFGDPAFVFSLADMCVDLAGVPLGAHPVELQILRLPGVGRRVVRARVLWAGTVDDSEFEGEAGVDYAKFCICDPERIARLVPDTKVLPENWPCDVIAKGRGWGQYATAPGTPVLIAFHSGMGDGTYPVFRLHAADGALVGALVELISEEPRRVALLKLAGWREKRGSTARQRVPPSEQSG